MSLNPVTRKRFPAVSSSSSSSSSFIRPLLQVLRFLLLFLNFFSSAWNDTVELRPHYCSTTEGTALFIIATFSKDSLMASRLADNTPGSILLSLELSFFFFFFFCSLSSPRIRRMKIAPEFQDGEWKASSLSNNARVVSIRRRRERLFHVDVSSWR